MESTNWHKKTNYKLLLFLHSQYMNCKETYQMHLSWEAPININPLCWNGIIHITYLICSSSIVFKHKCLRKFSYIFHCYYHNYVNNNNTDIKRMGKGGEEIQKILRRVSPRVQRVNTHKINCWAIRSSSIGNHPNKVG